MLYSRAKHTPNQRETLLTPPNNTNKIDSPEIPAGPELKLQHACAHAMTLTSTTDCASLHGRDKIAHEKAGDHHFARTCTNHPSVPSLPPLNK